MRNFAIRDSLFLMMRQRAILLLSASVLSVAVLSTLGVGAAVSGTAPCQPGKSKLIAADTRSVIYLGEVPERHGPGYSAYLGCVRGARRAYDVGGPGVGSSSGAGATRKITLVGPIVAWEEWEYTGVTGELGREQWRVLVRDLRTGKLLEELPTGTARVNRWVGVGPTLQIIPSSIGAVAWMAAVAGSDSNELEIHVADARGTRLVAAGSDIAPKSLALAGGTVYWTQAGMPRSVSLP